MPIVDDEEERTRRIEESFWGESGIYHQTSSIRETPNKLIQALRKPRTPDLDSNTFKERSTENRETIPGYDIEVMKKLKD